MRSLITFAFSLFLVPSFSFALVSGPVRAGSAEEREVSKALTDILTSPTGCKISETFFLLREKLLVNYFGMNSEAAKLIAEKCPGKDLRPFGFLYKNPTSQRAPKTYRFYLGGEGSDFQGWTGADNQTHIFMKTFDPKKLRRILAHELLITMDDKFYIQTKDMGKLGFDLKAPLQISCQIDRFLANPYYQSLLASLRAFRMELRFASELRDSDWLNELTSYTFLNDESVKSFEVFAEIMKPYQISILRFYRNYVDSCSGSTTVIKSLSDDQVKNLMVRDWQSLKTAIRPGDLGQIMDFLIHNIAISSSDANAINIGPRPVIGNGGWSMGRNDGQNLKITAPKQEFQDDKFKQWTEFHQERLEDAKKNIPVEFGVPEQTDSKSNP